MATPPNPISEDGERSQALLKRLSELPPKTRRTRKQTTLMEQVAAWYEHLKSAQERGYTYDELADLISFEGGISITAGTLRKYMAKAKKEQKTASAELSIPPISSASPLPNSPKATSNLPLDRQASLTRRESAPSDDIESQFSNLN